MLPIGLKCSPDIDWSIMESVLTSIDDAYVYIDNAWYFSSDGNHYIELLSNILCCLQENGFIINPLKCECAIKDTDLLSYFLSPWGLKPWKEK